MYYKNNILFIYLIYQAVLSEKFGLGNLYTKNYFRAIFRQISDDEWIVHHKKS